MAIAIPVINLPEDISSTPAPNAPSFFNRAKARIVNVAKRVAAPFATAGRATKKAAITVATKVKMLAVRLALALRRAAIAAKTKVFGAKSNVPDASRLWRVRRATDTAFTKAKAWTLATWQRVMRPFLRLRMIAFAVIGGVVALVASPLVTLATVFGVGLSLWGLSYAVEHLEASTSRAARWTLIVLEAGAAFFKGVAYATTALVVVALSATSLPFAASEVMELTLRYFDVSNAVTLSTMAYFIWSGNWGMAIAVALVSASTRTFAGRSLRRNTVDRQDVATARPNRRVSPPQKDSTSDLPPRVKGWDKIETAGGSIPHADEPREFVFADAGTAATSEPTEAPRRIRLPACTACGIDDGWSRMTIGRHRGICKTCFDAFADEDALKQAKAGKITQQDVDDAIKMGGHVSTAVRETVAARPRNLRVALSDEEVLTHGVVRQSIDDPDAVFWLDVVMWYDAKGISHMRERLAFVAGQGVGCVEYIHERKTRRLDAYVFVTKGDGKLGSFDKLGPAQDAIEQALRDQRATVANALEALRESASKTETVADVVPIVIADDDKATS